MASALLEELRDIRALMEEGGLAPSDLIAGAMERLKSEVDGSDRVLLVALRDEVLAIEALAKKQRGAIGDELERLSRGREMLKGYSALRPETQTQRLSRRA
jgi:hypothetical protein